MKSTLQFDQWAILDTRWVFLYNGTNKYIPVPKTAERIWETCILDMFGHSRSCGPEISAFCDLENCLTFQADTSEKCIQVTNIKINLGAYSENE